MAGTLTISTLSDGTNSTSATNPIKGSLKAWANYSGTAQTIRASYNVSSITRVSTGIYTVNFTNAFSDTSYVCTSGIGQQETAGGVYVCMFGNIATTSIRLTVRYRDDTLYDREQIFVEFTGNN
jgi:hypothetical protein